MGFLDNLFGGGSSEPSYFGGYEIPQEQSELISGVVDRAKEPTEDLSRAYTEGIEDRPGFLKQPQQTSRAQYGAGSPLMAAVQARAEGKYRRSLGDIRRQADMDAANERFSRLQSASRLVSAEHAHNERIKQAKYAERINRKRARGQALGNILGIGGAALGASIGGPGGAMAGYQLGQGVGQMGGSM